MNYQKIYNDFINDRLINKNGICTHKAKNSKPNKINFDGYCEIHHIVPFKFGGSHEPKNLVRLTADDHYFAHVLLAKIHGSSMSSALFLMRREARKISPRRLRVGFLIAKQNWKGNKATWFGRKHSEETKAKMSAWQKGKAKPKHIIDGLRKANLGRPLSEEHKKAISRGGKGIKPSLETKAKMSEARKGYIFDEETKQKIANTLKGRKLPQEHKDNIAKNRKDCKVVLMINNVGEILKEYVSISSVHEDHTYLTRAAVRLRVAKACKNNTETLGYYWRLK